MTPAPTRSRHPAHPCLVLLLAALAAVLTALLLPATSASAGPLPAAENGVGAIHPETILLVGVHQSITAGQHPVRTPSQPQAAVGRCVAAEEEGAGGLSEAFHYTGSQNVASIESKGLLPGSYATPNGELSPLQAQIDLALPPNRGLPGGLIRIDIAGLRQAGYDIPDVTQVGRSFNMPGGGYEMQFPYAIPPEFLKVISP